MNSQDEKAGKVKTSKPPLDTLKHFCILGKREIVEKIVAIMELSMHVNMVKVVLQT